MVVVGRRLPGRPFRAAGPRNPPPPLNRNATCKRPLSFAPSNLDQSGSRLLSLPDELLEMILAYATHTSRKTKKKEHPRSQTAVLHAQLKNMAACKRMYALAFDAHFIHNRLVTSIGSRLVQHPNFPHRVVPLGSLLPLSEGIVGLHGHWRDTFEKTTVFRRNVRKLEVRVQGPECIPGVVRVLRELIVWCMRLKEVVLNLNGLDKEYALKLKKQVEDAELGELGRKKGRTFELFFRAHMEVWVWQSRVRQGKVELVERKVPLVELDWETVQWAD